MELSEVGMGTKLELEVFDESGTRQEAALVSEFEWLEDKNTAVIAAPIFESRVVPLKVNSEINIYFVKRSGGLINLYKFGALIKDRGVSENLHILVIEKLSEIAKVQRRRYFRLDCVTEVQYRIVGNIESENGSELSYIKALSSNLSGGGICLMLEEKLEPGSLIECELFTENRKVRFFGKVVRFEDTGKEGKYRFEAGITYVEINDNDREIIVRYIFDEQRKLLKKGLI